MRSAYGLTKGLIAMFCFGLFVDTAAAMSPQDKSSNPESLRPDLGTERVRFVADTAKGSETNAAAALWLQQAGVYQESEIEFRYSPFAPASENPLGVYVSPLSPEFAGHLGLDQPAVVIANAPENCPGYVGGLRTYDVVLQIEDQKPESPASFDALITAGAGKPVKFLLVRRAEQMELALDVPNIASALFVAENQTDAASTETPPSVYRLGVVLASVDDVLRVHLNLPPNQGVLVTDVTPEGPAAKIGCEPNDIFLELDGKPIESQDQLRGQVQEIGDREVLLKLLRRGKNIEVKINPKLVTEQQMANLTNLKLNLNNLQLLQRDAYIVGLSNGEWAPMTERSLNRVLFADLYFPNAPGNTEGDGTANQLQQLKGNLNEMQSKLAEMMAAIEKLEKSVEPSKPKLP